MPFGALTQAINAGKASLPGVSWRIRASVCVRVLVNVCQSSYLGVDVHVE